MFKDFQVAEAHCDIPCKIYDPAISQVATLSVIRLIDLLHEIDESDNTLGEWLKNDLNEPVSRVISFLNSNNFKADKANFNEKLLEVCSNDAFDIKELSFQCND